MRSHLKSMKLFFKLPQLTLQVNNMGRRDLLRGVTNLFISVLSWVIMYLTVANTADKSKSHSLDIDDELDFL